MLDSIYVGMSGLMGYSQALRVIANNTVNINTPGFKSSSVEFADLFYSNTNTGSGLMQVGYGLSMTGTTLNFQQGELRQTGNNLDLAVDGQGLFTLLDSDGNVHYTRAGQFTFNEDGVLVSRTDGSTVLGVDANGMQTEISIANLSTAGAKATSTISFSGNLSSTATDQTVGSVKVIDSLGGEHMLSVKLINDGNTTQGTWTVQLLDGTAVVGTGTLAFENGRPTAASAIVKMDYTPSGLPKMPLTLDFSNNVTSFASGNISDLKFNSQDGYGAGSLTGVNFDANGTMILNYSNGQVVNGARFMLGRFDSADAVAARGSNQFDATNPLAWHIGVAGEAGFGRVRSGVVELSNVDLSREFSDLVIVQRGYQASSQVISTANDMLQELFTMKSR